VKSELSIARWFEAGWCRLYQSTKLSHNERARLWFRWLRAHCRRIIAKRAAAGKEGA